MERPGTIFPTRFGGISMVILIGILCTTLIKLPEAFWGGIKLNDEADAGDIESTVPFIS